MGKLHPLPIPVHPLDSIGMDIMGPFPNVGEYNYLWVVICRMTSMVHLIPVSTSTTASKLSSTYISEVVRLHGLPLSIVSDQDPKFMSKWWCEIQRLMGMKSLLSMAFHLQTHGIIEQVNHSIGQILREMICPDPKDWVGKLPLVEFVINSSITSATGMAPFKINYRYMPVIMKELKESECTPLVM